MQPSAAAGFVPTGESHSTRTRDWSWSSRLISWIGRGGIWGEIGAFWGCYLHKIGVFGIADGDDSVDLLNQLLLLIIIKLHVPLGQAGLPSPVLDQDEADLHQRGGKIEELGGAEPGVGGSLPHPLFWGYFAPPQMSSYRDPVKYTPLGCSALWGTLVPPKRVTIMGHTMGSSPPELRQ